jgi:hypothetical protein
MPPSHHIRRLLSLSLLLIAPTLLAQSSGDVAINEIVANNATTIANELGVFADWFELHNPTGVTIDIGDHFLSDDDGALTKWRIPAGTTIAPGEHLLIWADDPPDPQNPAYTDLHAAFRLSAQGEQLIFTAANGLNILDQVDFPPLANDISYGPFPDAVGVLQRMDVPTPRAANQGPSGAAEPRINELLITNATSQIDSAGDFDPWIELINATGLDLDISGYRLTNDVGDPGRWPLPPGTTLEPGARLLIWLDAELSEGPLHANFTVTPGATVTLFRPDASTQVDQLTDAAAIADIARGRFPDGQDVLNGSLRPTPRRINEAFDPAFGVIINEYLTDSVDGITDETGSPEDWIELHNPTGAPVSVAGRWLTDDLSLPTKWQIPAVPGTLIPAGGFLLIWCDDEPDTNPADGRPHAAFRLDNTGEQIGLFAQTGPFDFAPLDTVVYGDQNEDVSEARFGPQRYARLPTSLNTPGAPNAFGLTIQQIVESITGVFTPDNDQRDEADANRDNVIDAADVTLRVIVE